MLVEERRGKGRDGERYNRGTEQRHPSHAVAAQLHSATSILPACLHSHSVDPFTEGMSHTLSSCPSPPPFPRRILSSPSPPCIEPPRAGSAARRHPLRTRSPSVTNASLSILSHPSLSSIQARQRLPRSPAIPLSLLSLFLPFPLSLSPFLSRVRLYILPKCPSFSLTLLCDAGR